MTTIVTADRPITFTSHDLGDGTIAIATDGLARLGVAEYMITGPKEHIGSVASAFLGLVKAMFPGGQGEPVAPGTLASSGEITAYVGDATKQAGEAMPELAERARVARMPLRLSQIVMGDDKGRMPWEQGAQDMGQRVFFDPPATQTMN